MKSLEGVWKRYINNLSCVRGYVNLIRGYVNVDKSCAMKTKIKIKISPFPLYSNKIVKNPVIEFELGPFSFLGGLAVSLNWIFGTCVSFYSPAVFQRSVIRHNFKFDSGSEHKGN